MSETAPKPWSMIPKKLRDAILKAFMDQDREAMIRCNAEAERIWKDGRPPAAPGRAGGPADGGGE